MHKTHYRTHNCNQLCRDNLGQEVKLCGWVHRKRDHGGLLFIDLRDNFGLTQLIFEPEKPFFKEAEILRVESCIQVSGNVVKREDEAINKNIATGEIEIQVEELNVISACSDLPLPVFAEPDYPEDIRLKYRYLDLRRTKMHENAIMRSKIISLTRKLMEENNFTEFQTPILTASSPEGARDFIVPSRLHPEKFYALPQAPQIFKQLLMISGFDRYFQIAPCFRDEDARADRSAGEFYQLDLEMSFVTKDDVFNVLEPIIFNIFNHFSKDNGKNVGSYPFQRISYADSLMQYGTDKPDLRNPIKMQDVSDVFVDSGFKIFANILASQENSMIMAIPAPKGGSRAFCDRMNSWAQKEGLPGMGYIIFDDEGAKGPIAKNIGDEKANLIKEKLELSSGDAAFFLAGLAKDFLDIAAKARQKIAIDLELLEDGFAFAWIVDFPMFEYDEVNKKIDFGHNPFSMPKGGLKSLENEDPLKILAEQYDLVCNGYELGSGAIRNHDREIMEKAFSIVGYDKQFIKDNFDGLYDAFQYGAPPHGGAAFGMERIIMLLCDEKNIREVTLFPLNQQAQDLMLGAPSKISEVALKEANIKAVKPIKVK